MKVQGKNVLINDPPSAREDCTSPKTDWTASVAH